MELMQAILERRSVRKFTDQPVSREILEKLADAALHAPSGRGSKTWKFTVVSNAEAIAKLCAAVGKALGRENYDMYKPVALIIPSNDPENDLAHDDNACALQNIFLAAYGFGVGSVWINQLRDCCDEPGVRAVLTELGIPENYEITGIAALGYADPDAQKGVYKEKGEVNFVE